MIIVGGHAHSQNTVAQKRNLLPMLQNLLYKPALIDIKKRSENVIYKSFIAADFYSKQLGFFCRQEIKMDKFIRVPFRFRLGSIEQVDWLEGKGNRRL